MSRKSVAAQKGVAPGHKWVMAALLSHPDWLGRGLDSEDAEVELIEKGEEDQILELRIGYSERIRRKEGHVEIYIDGKHIAYAKSCRYPVILVRVDLTEQQGWYFWLQPWILERYAAGDRLDNPKTGYSVWIEESRTLSHGLDLPLKNVARWKGEAHLAFKLLDALRAAAATGDDDLTREAANLLVQAAPRLEDASVCAIVQEAGGFLESGPWLALLRALGSRFSVGTIGAIAQRDGTGLAALGMLYDEHLDHLRTLRLPAHFQRKDLPRLAYYCALREAAPEKQSPDFLLGPGDFVFAGLRFHRPPGPDFWVQYERRGVSAILDSLMPESAAEAQPASARGKRASRRPQ